MVLLFTTHGFVSVQSLEFAEPGFAFTFTVWMLGGLWCRVLGLGFRVYGVIA